MKTDKKNSALKTDRILYDARGVRVTPRKGPTGFVRVLLYYIIPYIIINGIVFILVTAAPEITSKVKDTDNYITTTVTFSVKSLLPVKSVSVTLEGEELAFEQSGSNYTLEVNRNGTLQILAVSINGMQKRAFAEVSVLDDEPPFIEESSCVISADQISFKVSDGQSGVNYSSIRGTCPDGTQVAPVSVNKETETVVMPMEAESLELYFEDMAGNSRMATITAEWVDALKAEAEVRTEGAGAEAGTETEKETGTGQESAGGAETEKKA